jgi:Rieske Fe-S protein
MARQAPEQGLFYPGAEAAAEAERRSASPNPGADVPVEIKRGFFWPKKVGAFGGEVNGGNVEDYKVGDVKLIQDAKAYVSLVPEGFVALWWKCPHLGCTVPWKPDDPTMDSLAPKGRFNCPCHGSIYDRYGDIIQGPAPRPMDVFPVTIRDGKVYIDTNPTHAVQRTSDTVTDAPVPA